MKKFALVLAILLAVGIAIPAYAGSVVYPSYKDVIYVDQYNDVDSPNMIVKRVRYGMEGANASGLQSGDVVMWDTVSRDGITVSKCTGTTAATRGVAGVLVTALVTQDVGSTGNIKDDDYGYMAVGGYCLAKIDVSEATDGMRLVPSSAEDGYFSTGDLRLAASTDAGVLLSEPSSDGVGAVYLNIQ